MSQLCDLWQNVNSQDFQSLCRNTQSWRILAVTQKLSTAKNISPVWLSLGTGLCVANTLTTEAFMHVVVCWSLTWHLLMHEWAKRLLLVQTTTATTQCHYKMLLQNVTSKWHHQFSQQNVTTKCHYKMSLQNVTTKCHNKISK